MAWRNLVEHEIKIARPRTRMCPPACHHHRHRDFRYNYKRMQIGLWTGMECLNHSFRSGWKNLLQQNFAWLELSWRNKWIGMRWFPSKWPTKPLCVPLDRSVSVQLSLSLPFPQQWREWVMWWRKWGKVREGSFGDKDDEDASKAHAPRSGVTHSVNRVSIIPLPCSWKRKTNTDTPCGT